MTQRRAGSFLDEETQPGPKRSPKLSPTAREIAHESAMHYVSWMMLRGGGVCCYFSAPPACKTVGSRYEAAQGTFESCFDLCTSYRAKCAIKSDVAISNRLCANYADSLKSRVGGAC